MRSGLSRGTVLQALAALPALGAAGVARAQAQELPGSAISGAADFAAQARAALRGATGTKLVLLGTGGGPVVNPVRHATSHAIVSDGKGYVIDCGLGVTQQLVNAGVPLSTIRNVFLTHHHPDHTVEYGPLLLLSWVNNRVAEIDAYGPPPLAFMTSKYLEMQKFTIDTWIADLEAPPFPKVAVHELQAGGFVMRDDAVTVTCAVVEHPPVKPAFAYRFDFRDRSIVFSGDTVAVDAVAALAKNADILVHEAIDLRATEALARRRSGPEAVAATMAHMRRDHTPAAEAGRIATAAGVKTLVLSHLVPGQGVPDDAWRDAAATTFKGEILVAHDLMVI